MDSPVVSISRIGATALVCLNNPPVNALSKVVRQGLIEAFARLKDQGDVSAIVLSGGPGRFIAGADVREMDLPLESPTLPEVVAAIEATSVPVIAAIDGPALGGGLEIALACDMRFASPTAKLGLPETKLGIIPGAGGTQRLCRLVGIADAITLISDGRILTAQEAAAKTIVDEVVGNDLTAAAIACAAWVQKRRISERPVPDCDLVAEEKAAETAIKRNKGAPAVREAIRVIRAAAHGSFAEGVHRERQAFLALRESAEAAALRHLFFAERESWKVPDIADAPARPLETAAVIGAGTMGAAIAVALAGAGLTVLVLERDAEAVAAGTKRIHGLLEQQVKSGRLTSELMAKRVQHVSVLENWDGLSDCDLVVEAAFEDMAIKREIFARLDRLARPGAILASNTSYLDLDDIAAATSRPQDVIGLHFFSPAHIMKLLEIVRGDKTAPDVIATAFALARKIGKQPILARNCDGFIGNRIYALYRRHAEYLVEDGAWPEDVDAAMEAYGFAMGIFAVSDLSGLDIAFAMRQRRAATRAPDERYIRVADVLCEAGHLGRKTGAGWYDYSTGDRKPDDYVRMVIGAQRFVNRIAPRQFSQEEIQNRLLAVMANEGAKLLVDGIALRASDIDVAFVNGYGFPRAKGGPMWAADQRGLTHVLADVQAAYGAGGAGSEPSELLAQLARSGGSLSKWSRP